MTYHVPLAQMHIIDLHKRAEGYKPRQQSRSILGSSSDPFVASAGTFFDDDAELGDMNVPSAEDFMALRAESAMSSRSEERSRLEGRLPRIDEARNEPSPSRRPTTPASSRPELWPQALKIAKPLYLGHERSFSSHSLNRTYDFPAASHVATSQISSDSLSSRYASSGHSRKDSSSSASSVASLYDNTTSPNTPDCVDDLSEDVVLLRNVAFTKSRTPGTFNSHAAAGSAPMANRTQRRRLKGHMATMSESILGSTSSTGTDWTAVAPSKRFEYGMSSTPARPGSPATMFTSTLPGLSTVPNGADVVIGRALSIYGRDRSSSEPDLANPTYGPSLILADAAFAGESTRITQIHIPLEPQLNNDDSHSHQLSQGTYTKRRSVSADETTIRNPAPIIPTSVSPPAATPTPTIPSTPELISPGFRRPDRATSITDAIRELNAKSTAHFERYTKLRQSRQMLHSEILSTLQARPLPNRSSKTPLQLQIEIAKLDAGIDDCMTRLATLDKKRQRLTEDLLALVAPTSPAASASSHSRNQSVGIQEIISPMAPSFGRMAPAQVPVTPSRVQATAYRRPQKSLPSIPREERVASNTFSLANIMDFLDTSEADGY